MSTTQLPRDTQVLEPVRRPADHDRRPRRWRRLLLILLAAAAAAVGGAAALRLAHPGVLPGVTVAGVDVGGADRAQLRATVEQVAATTQGAPVTVTADGNRFDLAPSDVAYRVDVDATVEAAWRLGRGGNPFSDTWAHVTALFGTDHRVTTVDGLDQDALTRWVDELAGQVDRPATHGDLVVDPESFAVTTTPPVPGLEVQRESTRQRVTAVLRRPTGRTVDAAVAVTDSPVDVATFPEVVAAAKAALAQPLVVSAHGTSVTLDPEQVAPLLTITADGTRARLGADPQAVASTFADLAGELEVPATDAGFDVPREPAVTFDDKDDATWEPVPVDVPVVPSTPGRTFDAQVVADEIGTALRAGRHDVDVVLPTVEAELTTEDAEALGIDTLLGTFTTYHAAGQPRVTNIHLLADVLDGTILRPGEQFSINDLSGDRTCAKGYLKDGMILGGKLVPVCGGGVSQIGTTTFNAAFFAGVQIDAHKPHSWYISRYPMGREATLDYATDIDVEFTNTTSSGMLVRTHYTSTSITVSLYGHSDVERVTADLGAPHNRRPYPTQYVESSAIAPGTSYVKQHGANGFDVDVVRVVEHADGTTDRRTFSHRYVPEPQIVVRNTQPPQPEPSPQPSDHPTDQPSPQPSAEPSPSAQPSPQPSASEDS